MMEDTEACMNEKWKEAKLQVCVTQADDHVEGWL